MDRRNYWPVLRKEEKAKVRLKGEIAGSGVEISVIWSRRRDAWTYLRGADAREEKRGFSYRGTTRRNTRDPHTVTSRIPLAVNGRNLLSVCVCVCVVVGERTCEFDPWRERRGLDIGGYCVISGGQWVFWQSKLGLGEFSPFGI